MIKEIARSLLCNAYILVMQDTKDINRTILLAGLGRSGTTWISNSLNPKKELRNIFEPFNRIRHCNCKKINFMDFHCHLYIRPEDAGLGRLEVAKKILSGELKDLNFDFQNVHNFLKGNGKLKFSRRIVKAICANLFLKWINVNFNQIPIVLVMRHPIPVVLSRESRGWYHYQDRYPFVSYLRKRPELLIDHLNPFKDYLESLADPFDIQIANWCIQHYVPLRQFNSCDNIYIVFYEQLCLDPESEFEKLYRFLNIDAGASHNELFNGVYATQNESRAQEIKSGNRLHDWRNEVTVDQIDKTVSILERFGLTSIYTDTLAPSCQNTSILLDSFSPNS